MGGFSGSTSLRSPEPASGLGPPGNDPGRGAGLEFSRERPSTHGAFLGEALADLAKAGNVGGPDFLSLMCATCAFRDGCMPNQMAATGIVALNCVLGIDPDDFACHHGMKDGEPTKLCAGALAAKRAPFEVVKSVLHTLTARLASLSASDRIRADFDAWVALVDPDGRMDDHERARAYVRDRDRSANADRREAAGPEGQEPGPAEEQASPEPNLNHPTTTLHKEVTDI